MVMRDPTTKRARGFGFITFADPTAVEKVLALEAHELDGKRIDPKIAFPKKQQPKMVIKTKKVFIGGLSSSSTVIKLFFSFFSLYILTPNFSWKTSKHISRNTGESKMRC
jgi:RNA-binding protein Musashi